MLETMVQGNCLIAKQSAWFECSYNLYQAKASGLIHAINRREFQNLNLRDLCSREILF